MTETKTAVQKLQDFNLEDLSSLSRDQLEQVIRLQEEVIASKRNVRKILGEDDIRERGWNEVWEDGHWILFDKQQLSSYFSSSYRQFYLLNREPLEVDGENEEPKSNARRFSLAWNQTSDSIGFKADGADKKLRELHPDIHETVTLAVSNYVPPNEAGHEYVKHAEERGPQ